MIVGVIVGLLIAHALSNGRPISEHLRGLAYANDARVRQGIIILKMLETNDVARAKHFLNSSVAADYRVGRDILDQDFSYWVTSEARQLPDLMKEIERQQKQPTNAPTLRR